MGFESGKGWVNVSLTFNIHTMDDASSIEKAIIKYIDDCLKDKEYPYERMELEHIEIDGSDIDYRDWEYEDRINYLEDTREKR
tara:strand:+ start:136 stop:384 length:249 start_codon:yes stop_codon:yes gene_type:complete